MLGPEAVRRYYAWQLSGPHEVVALGARSDGVLVGFCFAGIFKGAMSGFIHHNRAYLLWRMAGRPDLLLRPEFRSRIGTGLKILSKVFRRRSGAKRSEATFKSRPFGILSIAVAPGVQGSGVATELERTCTAMARRMGYSEMGLTVAPSNIRAIRFYERNGWTKIVSGMRWEGRMRKPIQP
jgi:ribosomal protein S18 acetylase RimI-like enzyme